MHEEKLIMFRNRLEKVFRHKRKQAKRLQVSCYRLYDQDLPEFPFCVELYADKIYVAEYKRRHGMAEDAHNLWMEKCLAVIADVLQVDEKNIFTKLRQRKQGRLGQYQKVDQQQHEIVVEEAGLQFIVNLSDYLDTGLFLDHRITRQLVKEKSEGKKVLNLFAYTGSFSVYAAAGGAKEVLTVDLSNTYLNWAKRNFQVNGFAVDEDAFIQADVKAYLKTIAPGYFDIIVMDPPTFSNSKRMDDVLDIQRDHPILINDCLKALAADGVLYFSTNLRSFKMEVAAINATQIKDITQLSTAFDFSDKLFRTCFAISK